MKHGMMGCIGVQLSGGWRNPAPAVSDLAGARHVPLPRLVLHNLSSEVLVLSTYGLDFLHVLSRR